MSRTLDLGETGIRSIAYNTRSQSVSVLEDDSASVWRLLYENDGDATAALAYIAQAGTFPGDPAAGARETLAGFAEELTSLGLLEPRSDEAGAPVSGSTASASRPDEIAPEGERTEIAFAGLMADHHVLYSLVLELTYRCNESCVHCYCPSDRILPELTLPQIEYLLDEFQALGGFSLQLTGGEVFVRKDIRELLRSLRRRRLLLSITSNLTLLDDEGADLVSDLHPKSVGCSIYSARADLHDSITRHPGSFEKSLAGIRKLRDRGVPVAIKTPLMASTAPGCRDVVALATGLGCESQFDLNITARNDGDLGPVHHRVREEAVIADILRDAFPRVFFGDERPGPHSGPNPEALLCGAGATGLAVSPDGTMRPCVAFTRSLGRWPGDSLASIWRNSPFFAEWTAKKLRDIDRCISCESARLCIRCPGAWIAESGYPLKPLDYSCRLSEIRSRVAGEDS